jgi:hypothetical protein
MSSGGGSTTSTVTQSIPKEFYPQFNDLLTRANAASLEDYQTYGEDRLADVSADTAASQGMIRGIAGAGSPATQRAMGMTQDVYDAAGNIGSQGPYQFSQFGYSDPGTFSGQAIGQYMSPYMQNVVNQQKMSALEDFQMANAGRAAQAQQAGAFGGSRFGIQQGLAERDLLSRTNQIQAQGLQQAYTDAQNMFERDRAARMASEQARAAELSRVQSGQSAENLNYANLGLNTLQFQSDLAGRLSSLGQTARGNEIQSAQLMQAQGAAQEQRQQARRDIAYQDFLAQRGHPMAQLERYAQILHGSPIANATSTTTPYNPVQQALGLGISALGLYNAYAGV